MGFTGFPKLKTTRFDTFPSPSGSRDKEKDRKLVIERRIKYD